MEILYTLKDEEYPKRGLDHTRNIVRAFVCNDDGLFAIHLIERDDMFGKCTYFETPGGGVEPDETLKEALKRECLEELGYEIEIIDEVGIVEDSYNYISRKNINHYYLAKITKGDGKKIIASEGDSLIKETKYLPLDEIISLYEKMDDHLVSGLVKRRELPLWRLVKEKLTCQH